MAHYYRVYGLSLVVDRALPGLIQQPASHSVDWQVSMDSLLDDGDSHENAAAHGLYESESCDDDGEPTWKIWRLAPGQRLRLRFRDGTDFRLDFANRQISAQWPDGLTLEDATTYLLGPVLGFTLRQLGYICLHGSAVAIGNQAIALVGSPGAGKSTTAAAFAQKGLAVLSDDILALTETDNRVKVQPGYPRVNLWPDAAQALWGTDNALPRITSSWDKRYLDLHASGGFAHHALPLAAIYIFAPRIDQPRAPLIESLAVQAGLMSLIGNTYANCLLDSPRRASEFNFLGRLANRTPLRRITAHSDPQRLTALCHLILDDVNRLTDFTSTPQPQSNP